QAAKLRTIGFMGATAPAAVSTWVAAFVQGLRERTLHPPGQLLGPPAGGSAFARPTDLGSSVELHYFLLAWLPDGGLEKRILGGANRPIIKAGGVDGIRHLHRQAEPAIQLLDFFQEGFRPCRAATQGNARRLC